MRKAMFVCLIGLILILLPYLGIPEFIREYVLIVSGVLLCLFGYLLMRDEIIRRSGLGNGERGSDSFTETTTPLFTEDTLQ